LLLHPPSRIIFGREVYMNLLLDLLDPYNCPAIQSQALLVLVTALLATPQNTRTFEHMDGLLTVTSLFKDEETTKNVKVKLLEFLYFYLMPETPALVCSGAPASLPAHSTDGVTARAATMAAGRRRRMLRHKTRSSICSANISATSMLWSRISRRAHTSRVSLAEQKAGPVERRSLALLSTRERITISYVNLFYLFHVHMLS
jgi:hypothetical protein